VSYGRGTKKVLEEDAPHPYLSEALALDAVFEMAENQVTT